MENEIFGVCYVCGCPLKWDENNENCSLEEIDGEHSYLKSVRCSHCGTLYNYYVDGEVNVENEPIACGDQGFGECTLCSGTVVWSGDFMRSDYYDDPMSNETLDENDDAIVRSCTCSQCGCNIEVWEPSLNEMNSGIFPFWNNCESNVENG